MKTEAQSPRATDATKHTPVLTPGTLVRYSNPQPGEELFVFTVVEDNGDRVFIEDHLSKHTLNPTELVAREDVVAVELSSQ